MASPVGHSALGLAIGRGGHPITSPRLWPSYVFFVFAANAADLDFLPGLLVGNLNRFHQSISHSLVAAVLFGLLVSVASLPLVTFPSATRLGLLSGALYASHLLLDFFTNDVRAPYGQPLLWPLTSERFIAPWTPLGGVTHGNPGDPWSVILPSLFSWHNLKVIGLEVIIVLPAFLVFWYLGRRRASHAGRMPTDAATRR